MGKALLEQDQINTHLNNLKKYLADNDIDAAYISSFDPYLNEYVPMENCYRYYITGFTGSVANALVFQEGKTNLYVDGRYWEQADNEVDLDQINVRKVDKVAGDVIEDIKERGVKTVAFIDARTPYSFFKKIEEVAKPIKIYETQMERIIPRLPQSELGEIEYIDPKFAGKTPAEKIDFILENENEAYYLTAIDQIAWLTNARGYHLPNLSSFISRAFLTKNKAYILVDKGVKVSSEASAADRVEYIEVASDELINVFKKVDEENDIKTLNIDSSLLNCADYDLLKEVFGKTLTEKAGGVIPFQSLKDETELNTMIAGFDKANKAIFNTIKWAQNSVAAGEKVSERDLYNQTTVEYEKQGSREQSFGTIAGVGANGSIIHYGDPKSDVYINKNDMCLLDSGGYFDGGFATDTTRTFMGAADGEATPQMKKMYTLVLKGLINIQTAVFPENTPGMILDGLARAAMRKHGVDYMHGTGHGVGVHVHESGVRISSISDVPMKENQVVSLEPGIYIPGVGGVRLENIAIVEQHPEHEGFLRFKNMVYIGYDHNLIDINLLSKEEMDHILAYEEECKKRGTSFLS